MIIEVSIMNVKFYKLKKNRLISGVLSGLSDKFDFDLSLVRFLFIIFTVVNFGLGILIYECLSCGALIRRRRRVNLQKYRCGRCMGKLRLSENG